MKKIILTIATGVVLASCSSGWSCKKRYCDVKKIEAYKKDLLVAKEIVAIAKP